MKLPPDREIDALIAKHVFGFVWRRNKADRSNSDMFPKGYDFLVDEQNGFYRKKLADGFRVNDYRYDWVPGYTDQIGTAWKIVDAMQHDKKYYFELKGGFDIGWCVTAVDRRAQVGKFYFAEDRSPAVAICLAALRAKKVDI